MKFKKYIIAFIACFAFFCLYLFISDICNWKNGGGYIVQFLVVAGLASIWSSIVNHRRWKTDGKNDAKASEDKVISGNMIEPLTGEKQKSDDADNVDKSGLKTELNEAPEITAPLSNNGNKPLNSESYSSSSVVNEDEVLADNISREAVIDTPEKKISTVGKPSKKYLLTISLFILLFIASVLGYVFYMYYKSIGQNIETTESIEEAEKGIVKVVHSKRSKVYNLMNILNDLDGYYTKRNREWIYNRLTGMNYNVGKDFLEFDSLAISNQKSRDWLYNVLKKEQIDVGDNYNYFESLIVPAESLLSYSNVDEDVFVQDIYDDSSASEFYNKMKNEGMKSLNTLFDSYSEFYGYISEDFDFIHELYRDLLSKDFYLDDIGPEASFRKRLVYETGRKDLYKLIKRKSDSDIMPYDEFESKVLACLFPNIKTVYDVFSGKGRYLGSLYEFVKKMTNKKEREKFYKEDTDKDLKYRTLEQFEDAMKELHLI